MDERLAQLDRRVAAAADAWLADSRDAAVYGRLVAAVDALRTYLHPTLDEPGIDASGPPAGTMDDGEVLDDLGSDTRPTPVRQDLGADPDRDPVAVLDRLRGNGS